jgi:hypothetical protein
MNEKGIDGLIDGLREDQFKAKTQKKAKGILDHKIDDKYIEFY